MKMQLLQSLPVVLPVVKEREFQELSHLCVRDLDGAQLDEQVLDWFVALHLYRRGQGSPSFYSVLTYA
jgi:hypothetical protein